MIIVETKNTLYLALSVIFSYRYESQRLLISFVSVFCYTARECQQKIFWKVTGGLNLISAV